MGPPPEKVAAPGAAVGPAGRVTAGRCTTPGPGRYDVHDVFGGWSVAGAVKMAHSGGDHTHRWVSASHTHR